MSIWHILRDDTQKIVDIIMYVEREAKEYNLPSYRFWNKHFSFPGERGSESVEALLIFLLIYAVSNERPISVYECLD